MNQFDVHRLVRGVLHGKCLRLEKNWFCGLEVRCFVKCFFEQKCTPWTTSEFNLRVVSSLAKLRASNSDK